MLANIPGSMPNTPEKKMFNIFQYIFRQIRGLKQVNGRKCIVRSEKMFVQHDYA